MSASTIDLTDIGMFTADRHHESFWQLRSECPVHWNATEDGGFWALTTYDDVKAAYGDAAAFSSAHGAVLGGSFKAAGDTAAGDMLVAADPPRHRLLRRVLHPLFGTAMVDRIVAQIRPLLVDALAKMCADGGGDLAAHFALQLPIGTLMAMFDIGYQDAAHLVGLTRRMVGYRDAPAADGAVDERLRLAQVQAEIFGFFAELMDERQGSSGEDAVSRMLAADLNGSRFTEAQILYNCLNIAVGGNETTSHTTCAGVLAFTQHPAEWDRLTREPTLLPSALEEVLRWSSTNAYVQRVATKDILVRDKLISAGDSVTLWNVSANRDEEQFPEPERFDIGRSPNHHLTFGSGIHRCIGAVPGMAELTEVFSALLNGRVRFRLCGEPEKMRSNFILGYTALPLEVLPLVGR